MKHDISRDLESTHTLELAHLLLLETGMSTLLISERRRDHEEEASDGFSVISLTKIKKKKSFI